MGKNGKSLKNLAVRVKTVQPSGDGKQLQDHTSFGKYGEIMKI